MESHTFARLVAEDVKNRVTDQQREWLRQEENWERWRDELARLVSNLQGQIAQIEETLADTRRRCAPLGENGLRLIAEAETQAEERRNKVERFQFHVEARLDEVERMIALGSDGTDPRAEAVAFLRRAIERHREMMDEFDLEPTPVDEALWATLDGKWRFDQVEAEDVLANA